MPDDKKKYLLDRLDKLIGQEKEAPQRSKPKDEPDAGNVFDNGFRLIGNFFDTIIESVNDSDQAVQILGEGIRNTPVTPEVADKLTQGNFNPLKLARNSAEGIVGGLNMVKEGQDAFRKGDIAGGVLGTITGGALSMFGAAIPNIPVMSAFTYGTNMASEVIPEETIQTAMNPVSAITEPESLTGRSLSTIGDLTFQALVFGGLHKGAKKIFKGKETTITPPKDIIKPDVKENPVKPIPNDKALVRVKEEVKGMSETEIDQSQMKIALTDLETRRAKLKEQSKEKGIDKKQVLKDLRDVNKDIKEMKDVLGEKPPAKKEFVPFYENPENVTKVADKIVKGKKLTDKELQLQANFPKELELELQKRKESPVREESKPINLIKDKAMEIMNEQPSLSSSPRKVSQLLNAAIFKGELKGKFNIENIKEWAKEFDKEWQKKQTKQVIPSKEVPIEEMNMPHFYGKNAGVTVGELLKESPEFRPLIEGVPRDKVEGVLINAVLDSRAKVREKLQKQQTIKGEEAIKQAVEEPKVEKPKTEISQGINPNDDLAYFAQLLKQKIEKSTKTEMMVDENLSAVSDANLSTKQVTEKFLDVYDRLPENEKNRINKYAEDMTGLTIGEEISYNKNTGSRKIANSHKDLIKEILPDTHDIEQLGKQQQGALALMVEGIKRYGEAPKNKIFTEEKYQAGKDIINKAGLESLKKAPSGLGGLESYFKPEVAKAIRDVAGYHFEKGVRTFGEFSKKMIEEFGAEIKPHLLRIWADVKKAAERGVNAAELKSDKSSMTAKEKVKAETVEKQFNKELSEFLDNKEVDAETKRKIYKIVEKVDAVKKYSSINEGFIRKKLLDKGRTLTKKYGAAGGEFYNRLMSGNSTWKKLVDESHEQFINPLNKIKEETTPYKFGDAFEVVVSALENRANAKVILGENKLASEMYPHVQGLYDYFRKKLEERGYETKDDYFTHIMRNNLTSQIFDNAKELKDVGKKQIHDFFTANSNYLKERTRDEMPLMRRDFDVLKNYVFSATRELAYKDFMEYASKGFLEDLKQVPSFKNADLSVAKEILRNVLNPEVTKSKALKTIGKVRGNLYVAYLWNNLKVAAQNTFQKELAKPFISKEAEVLTNKLYKEKAQPTGRLVDAISEVANETPPYLEAGTPESFKGNIRKKVESVDLFKKSEKGNWIYTEMAGVINSVMRNTKAKTLTEIAKALEDQRIFDLAVRDGRNLAARTQFSPDVAFRPLAYDKVLFRTFAMFTRYPIGASELFIKSLFKKLDGVDGIRAQNILRRGMTEDAKPVEFLRATEFMRKSLETAIKEDLGDNKVIKQYVNFLKGKEKELNKVIRELEPFDRKRATKKWAKYIAINAAISFTYRMLQNSLYQALGTKEDKSTGKIVAESLLDASPLPLYRFNPSQVFQAPLLPDINMFTFGKLTFKRGVKDAVGYGVNVTPGLNVVNQALGRFTGKQIDDYLFNTKSSSRSSRRSR